MSVPIEFCRPIEANLLITGRCNLRCRHCSVDSFGRTTDELPLSAWRSILDELVSIKVLRVTLTGGEPLVREDFPDFLKEIAARPLRLSINTNGTLLSKNMVRSIRKVSHRLDTVMLSLDGPDGTTHDSQRGTGAFRAMMNGADLLRTGGVPFGFYCTVTSLNVHRLQETAEVARQAGADWIKFNNFVYAGPDLHRNMIPDAKELRYAASRLRDHAGGDGSFVMGTVLQMQDRLEKIRREGIPEGTGKCSAYGCGGGCSKIAVFPDGTVTPCDHLPMQKLGNLTEKTITGILSSPENLRFRSFLHQRREDYPRCRHCEYLPVCTGGCPVEALEGNERIGYDRHSCIKDALESEDNGQQT